MKALELIKRNGVAIAQEKFPSLNAESPSTSERTDSVRKLLGIKPVNSISEST
jgi:hypothetical protein